MKRESHIYYLFCGRFPGEKAAAMFAAKSTEAFDAIGNSSTLVVPRRFGRSFKTAQDYYGLSRPIAVTYIPTIDAGGTPFFGPLLFRLGLVFFGIISFFYLLFRVKKGDVIISNEMFPLLCATYTKGITCYEMHDYPEKNLWLYRVLFSRVDHLLVTNRVKMDRLANEFPSVSAKAFYEPNAVSLDEFAPRSKNDARTALSLPLNKTIGVYTGHLFSWKGVDTLAKAASLLPKDFLIYFVGGTQRDIEEFRKKYGNLPNVHIIGLRPHKEIPLWQSAADALILPNTGKEVISREYTSPMKLFEYMASNRPIVASNIPSIADILTSDTATLVEPDNPQALAEALSGAVHSTAKSENAARALSWVKEHTWEKRARRILQRLWQ